MGDAEIDEVHELMLQAARLPDGLEQMHCVERAVEIAEKIGELELQFELQLKLAQTSFNCGQLEKTIVAVAWCFGMQDRHPNRFSYESLLSICTYAMNSLSSLPTSSRAQIANLLDNIEQRYVAAGYSLRAIYRARCFNALWMGDPEEADRADRKMKRCPLDFTYEGELWERLFEVDYLLQRGRLRKAFHTAQPILSAGDDAHGTYCWLASFILLPLLHLGKGELAEEAQRRSWKDVVENPSYAECVGHHILYLVATSRLEEAQQLVDRCLHWAWDAPLLRESFELALAALACVRRMRRLGRTTWPGKLPTTHEAALGGGDLELLEAALEQFVTASASRFDARNGNQHYADLIGYRIAIAEPSWEPSLKANPEDP